MSGDELRIADELHRWCPGVWESLSAASTVAVPKPSSPVSSLPDAERYCRELATSHYENFPVIARLLPSRLRQPMFNVYAYCRWSDDLGDEVGDRDMSSRLLAWWRTELHDCFAGHAPRHPVFVALQRTVSEFDLSRQPFDDLLTAFEQDQRVTEYATFDELLGYCRNSANPVGRIVLKLCGVDEERSLMLSDSVCTGLQLANFWQDVARDADISRTYLPREDCERFGYSAADLASRNSNDAFVRLMQFEVDRARRFLSAIHELAPRVPGRMSIAIDLFGAGGLRICDRIEAIGFRVWNQRPVVTKWDALSLLGRCLLRSVFGRKGPR